MHIQRLCDDSYRRHPKAHVFLIIHKLPQGTEARAGYVADLRGNADLLLRVRNTLKAQCG